MRPRWLFHLLDKCLELVTKRLIDISEIACRLRIRGKLLVIRPSGEEVDEQTIPIDSIRSVILGHSSTTISSGALAALALAGVSVVTCDQQHRPAGIMLPIVRHGYIADRFAKQSAMSRPVKKRLWRQVVRAKVRQQANLLQGALGQDEGLTNLASEIRSGDPKNIEAQAAIRYWSVIFEEGFLRNTDAQGRNALLNYGYSIARSITAQAICGFGLHPALGIFHHSRGNPLCLADDLMEPYRSLVDYAVLKIAPLNKPIPTLEPATKKALIELITRRRMYRNEARTLFDHIERSAWSMARAVMGKSEKLYFPQFNFDDAS